MGFSSYENRTKERRRIIEKCMKPVFFHDYLRTLVVDDQNQYTAELHNNSQSKSLEWSKAKSNEKKKHQPNRQTLNASSKKNTHKKHIRTKYFIFDFELRMPKKHPVWKMRSLNTTICIRFTYVLNAEIQLGIFKIQSTNFTSQRKFSNVSTV